MASPQQNILQQVQTYQMSALGYLQNLCCFVANANTRFKDFEKLVGNLGDTVTFDLPPRFTTTNSLVATFQPADQRVQPLVCSNQVSTSYSFTSQQFIFNAEEYMSRFGKSAVYEIGAQIEGNIAQNCVTNTYRFYGDGVTPINSFTQLAQALAFYRNYGSASGRAKGFISDIAEPQIIGTGLNQFALDRNDKIAMSWELGEFSNCDWYKSNLLPIHISGTEGINGTTLTVVSTNANTSYTVTNPNGTTSTIAQTTDGSVTAILFSGTTNASDASSVTQYDKFQFQDGVSGQPNMRYLTFIGHLPSANPVQFQAIAAAGAGAAGGQTSNQVVVQVSPALQSNPTNSQNLNNSIVAGMQVKVLPSHRAGLIYAGDPLFVAMPRLPDQSPFYTGNEVDPTTGVSIRMYYGVLFGQNSMGMVHDAIWGSTLVPEYSMSVIFPL